MGAMLALATLTAASDTASQGKSASSPVEAQAAKPDVVERAVDQLAAKVSKLGGSMAVLALDAETGRVLIGRNEHAPMNPASNAKLVTAAAALRLLGPAHRFVTGLYGTIQSGAVDELVLRGQADPSLSTADLWQLAREAKAAGVSRIGSIAVDQSYFDDRYTPPAFDEQPGEWAPFRAPVSALSLDQNTVTFTVHPTKAGEPALLGVEPPGFVTVTGRVMTTSKREAEAMRLSLDGAKTQLAAAFDGTLPEGRVAYVTRRVEDPRRLAGYALRAAFEALGVRVTGDVTLGGAQQQRAIRIHRSAPLGELLFALGKHSDNFYAETIFKAIGAERAGRPGTAEGAATSVTAMLRDLGAYESGVVIRNGSGLFNGQILTAHALATVLQSSWADPAIAPEFIAELAIGGVDGTLHGRFKRWAKTRAIRAKTGTLNAVSALSGYVLAPSGRPPIVFTILVNGVPNKVSVVRPNIDAIVDALTRQAYGSEPTLAAAR
jgi:D-alanyl-D-alanine carboxypeptidase/D-alanyl-D-alanine-endopeptidase (penicillin-binding protein 4)